jgi:hypothetical protein
VARTIEEDKMKIIIGFCLTLAIAAFAQTTKTSPVKDATRLIETADWSVSNEQGLIMEVSGDSLNYEERWIHVLPGVTALNTKEHAPLQLENIQAPCWVEISYFGKGKSIYLESLRFLLQFEYNNEGNVVGDFPDTRIE